jgi:hypothetical protein
VTSGTVVRCVVYWSLTALLLGSVLSSTAGSGDAGEIRLSSSGSAEYVSAVSHTGYAASEQEREETRACQR